MDFPPPIPPEILAYSNGGTLLGISASLFAVTAAIVIARTYTRIFVVKSLGSDDWTMIFAMLFSTACFALYVDEVRLGIGKYIEVIEYMGHDLELRKIRRIRLELLVVGISLVKISVSLFLMRLVQRKTYAIFLWTLIGFLVAFTVACLGTLIFHCIPVAAFWDYMQQPPPIGTGNARCLPLETARTIGLANGIINIITDFLLAILPVPLIWKLQMPLRTRITLILILSLGLFAAGAGIARQHFTLQTPTNTSLIHDSYAIWSLVELNAGIIASSLPALKPLFNNFFESMRSTLRSISKATQRTGFRSQSGGGHPYRLEDGDTLTLATITIHGPQGEGNKSISDEAKDSTDNILPRSSLETKQAGIVVTKRFQMA